MSEWPFVARSEEFRVALGALVTHSEHSGVILRGDGGVGKTTMTACIGAIFRESRPENVVAIDAAPGFGTLAGRIDDARHFIMLDQPQAFAQAVVNFLK